MEEKKQNRIRVGCIINGTHIVMMNDNEEDAFPLNRIYFYDHSGVLATMYMFDEINFTFKVPLNVKLVVRRKDNFHKKGIFLKNFRNEKKYDLYIHVDYVNLQMVSEKRLLGYKGMTEFLERTWRFSVESSNVVNMRYSERTTGPKYLYEDNTLSFNENVENSSKPTKKCVRLQKLAAQINDIAHIRLNEYDLDRILAEFNITKKKKKA